MSLRKLSKERKEEKKEEKEGRREKMREQRGRKNLGENKGVVSLGYIKSTLAFKIPLSSLLLKLRSEKAK